MLGHLSEHDVNPLVWQYQAPIKEAYRILHKHSTLVKEVHPGGPCVPGARKVLVTADGTFYPCERVDECMECMKIGNLNQGFNYDAIKRMLNCGKITETDCMNCWALIHCSVCASSIASNDSGQILPQDKLMLCIENRRDTKLLFEELCVLMENGFHLLAEE